VARKVIREDENFQRRLTDLAAAGMRTEAVVLDQDAAGHPGHGGEMFDWVALVARSVHPLKVGIIEALRFLGHPLSATELTGLLADTHYSADLVGYHAAGLVKLGVLEVTDARPIRGATRHYYYFSGRT
jgi:hypothetical protein